MSRAASDAIGSRQTTVVKPGCQLAEKRRRAIADYRILDSAPEIEFDHIVMLVAQIFGAQSAAISFIDEDRQWFKARYGIGPDQTPLSMSLCAHTIGVEGAFVVKDARSDPCFASNPLVTGPPHIRFYAGIRIFACDHTPIAALCVFDPEARPHGISEVERTTLEVLASQVEILLEMRRLADERQQQIEAQSVLAKKLRHVAEHDELTGLPNRGLFQKRLTRAISRARKGKTRFALMMVDVDHFKQINDSLGHDVGDALLRQFSTRLRSAIRKTDTVARLGGDEFGLLIPDIGVAEDIQHIIRSLIDRLHQPIRYRGRLIDCRASIGVSIYPDHADTAENLTKCSDLALGKAKQSRGCGQIFEPDMGKEFEQETKLLSLARRALVAGDIVPHYQPKVGLASGALVGFEALARFRTAEGALLLPEAIAPAFQHRELAVEITRQMIAKVMDDMRNWIRRGIEFRHIAINASAADFHGDDFAESLLAALDARKLNPGMVELEVTEGVFLGRGSHHVARAISVLSEAGMRIALDDFGTGYASLINLKDFNVDVLKIDRSFVAGIGTNPDDTAIVRALIGLGCSLGIETVGEGIETPEQAKFMQSHGCDIGQGYYFNAAQGANMVPHIVKQYANRAAA